MGRQGDGATQNPESGMSFIFRRQNLPIVIFAVGMAFVAFSIISAAWSYLSPYIADPTRDLSRDIDWGYLNRGLDRIHSFSDTARWWTGTWCGEVPFWRPLTSYVFWAMKLLWPKEYMLPRQVVLVVLHLCFMAMAGIFLWRLTRRPWLALSAVWLFAGTRFGSQLSAVSNTLIDPKNITEPLVGIAMLASLLLLVNGRWLGALVAAIISVGFKETGFTTWPLALLALAWINYDRIVVDKWAYVRESVKRNWLPVSAWLGALILLAVIHYLAVGIGYRMGTNHNWLWRAAMYHGGPVISDLISPDPAASIIAVLAAASVIGLKRMTIVVRFIGILLAFAVGVLVDIHIWRIPWDVSMAKLLGFSCSLELIVFYFFWLLIAWEAKHKWKIVTLGLVMCIVAAAPSWMAAQTLPHTLYLSAFFMEIAVAAALCQSARAIVTSH